MTMRLNWPVDSRLRLTRQHRKKATYRAPDHTNPDSSGAFLSFASYLLESLLYISESQMPSKLRDPRPDITLEVFVLEMLSHGVNTPYALLKQAGLSVGATYKLLQELASQKLLASSQEAGGRKTITFRLTTKGKDRLEQYKEVLLDHKPRGLEAALRVAYLVYSTGDAKQAAPVLREFASRHSKVSDAKLDRPKKVGPELYRWMLAVCDAARRQAESKALLGLAEKINNSSPRTASKSHKRPK
jgi:DNA-binding PadR family transcriptional regulator